MGLDLAQAVDSIAQAAGWSHVSADTAGVYRYFLEDGLDLELSSPDGRLCVLSADMGLAPTPDEADSTERLVKIGRLAAGIMKRRASVITVDDSNLQLTRTFDLTTASEQDCIEQASDFLNDEAWWKANLNDTEAPSSTSPFSMGGWFPGEMKF